MPWSDLAIRFLEAVVVISVAAWLYVAGLLLIGNGSSGVMKSGLSLILYAAMAAVMIGVFLLLMRASPDRTVTNSLQYVLTIIGGYVLAAVPGFCYIRSRISELREVGFFTG